MGSDIAAMRYNFSVSQDTINQLKEASEILQAPVMRVLSWGLDIIDGQDCPDIELVPAGKIRKTYVITPELLRRIKLIPGRNINESFASAALAVLKIARHNQAYMNVNIVESPYMYEGIRMKYKGVEIINGVAVIILEDY